VKQGGQGGKDSKVAWCMILRERWHGGVIMEVAMEVRVGRKKVA